MRHHNSNRKFGRETGQRRALLRSLSRSLLLKNQIMTTEARAKELRPHVEKMITHGKRGTLASRRILIAALGGDAATATKLIKKADTYKTRKGGYLRIVKLSQRKGDGSSMAIIEFV